MISAYLVGADDMVRRLEKLPEATRVALTKRLYELSYKLEKHIKNDYLSGQALNVVSDRLRDSIHTNMDSSNSKVVAATGTNVKYGRVHELGFEGLVNVREFVRKQTMAWGRPMETKQVVVRAHNRAMHLPARPFLAPALADMREEILAGIEGAIQDGVRSV